MPHTPFSDLRWNALFNDFRKSGLTHAAFCQLRGISLHTFRKRLDQAPSSTGRHLDCGWEIPYKRAFR
jgi:hypothetical protein